MADAAVITLQPGEYKVIYCADEAKVNTKTGEIFLDMGLNRYGEMLYLIDPAGVVVDDFRLGRLDDGYACGLVSDTDPKTYYFTAMTPGQANPSQGLGGPSPTPVFSRSTGYANQGDTVAMEAPGCVIRYTTDGSEPTASSPVYSGPVSVDKTVTIRARAFMEGRLPSDDTSVSLIVGRTHNMPVIFLSTEDANLYDYNTGIFADGPGKSSTFPYQGANFWKDWERPIHFEYMVRRATPRCSSTPASRCSASTAGRWIRRAFPSTCGISTAPRRFATPFSRTTT